jgi:hypothetical protein
MFVLSYNSQECTRLSEYVALAEEDLHLMYNCIDSSLNTHAISGFVVLLRKRISKLRRNLIIYCYLNPLKD